MTQRELPSHPPVRRRRRKRSHGFFIFLLLFLAAEFFVIKAAVRPEPAEETLPIQTQPALNVEYTTPAPAQAKEIEWNLRLVNAGNSLPEDYSVELTQLSNGLSVDTRCYPKLQEMMDACRAEGLQPLICSAYRSQELQEELFQNKISQLLEQGYSEDTARKEAGTYVAVPGTSEHQLGLAVDIVDLHNQLLDESQEKTAVQQWLLAHSWEYGFILRYPSEKGEITGIAYEPWHYRYVGQAAAEEIHTLGVCLEEYLELQGQ